MMPERLYYLFICYANNLANLSIRKSCKIPESFEKSCHQNVSTDVKFDDLWKNQTSNFCPKTHLFKNYKDKFGLIK